MDNGSNKERMEGQRRGGDECMERSGGGAREQKGGGPIVRGGRRSKGRRTCSHGEKVGGVEAG